MKRAVIILGILVTLFATPVHASGPEVHCSAYASRDGMVQVDCYGDVMREVYERLVPRYAVYDALAPIAQEWSFDLTWTEASA